MAKIDPMYHLVNTIFDHKEVVIFLGGGASKEGTRGDSNFPDSEQLMKEVVADYGITPKSKTELRNYFFEIIKNWEDEKKLGVRLRKYLDGDPGAAHYYLAALSIALYGESNALLYLTTTFDDLMERAFTDVIKNSIRRFRPISLSIRPQMTGSECHTIANAIEGNLKTGQPVIVKLFGDLISGPQILRRNEMNFPPEMEATLIRWMSKPMIAIGYRFSDKSLKNLLMASRGTAPVFIVNPSKMIPSVIKNMDRVNHIKKDFSGFMAELLTLLGEKNWKPTEKIEEILNTLQQFPALPGLKKKENNTNTKPFEILEEEGKSKGHLFFPEISIGEKPVKILILSANPQETTRIRTDEEVREIDSVLRRSANHNLFKIKVRLAVRFLDIRDALLDEKPHLVHFIGHSRSNGLMVEDEIGNAKNIQPDVLARIFEMSQGHILCVFLGACYTKELATAISNHIDFVIGNPGKISDNDAIKFSVAFYEALGAGKDYETAFKFGLSALKYLNASSLPVFFKKKKHVTLAIRSFHHFNDDLENEADYILDLCNRFDKRKLVTGTWEDIKRDIINFIRNKAKFMVRCDFHLPLHSPLVFLTGREFPFKSGIEANVFQYLPQRKLWRIPKNVDWEKVEKWIVETYELNSTGDELAVALSVTHNIGMDLNTFIKSKLPNVSHFIHLRLKHPNHQAIENSSQAYGLSVRAIQEISNQKIRLKVSRIHLFFTAPNAFVFRLGQNSTQLTNMTLYDYDAKNGGYTQAYSIMSESVGEVADPEDKDKNTSTSDEIFLENFYSVIEENYQDPDFNDHVASEKLNLERNVLYKKIKELTDITPTVHIIRVRCDHAARLIRDNNELITNVALAAGFSTLGYFYKCFKDQYGMSPSNYKKAKFREKKTNETDKEKEPAVNVRKSSLIDASPFDYPVEELDRELIARGKQMSHDKGISFPDIDGNEDRDAIIKRLKELYDLDLPSKLRDELKHIRTEDLVKILLYKTGQIKVAGVKGEWGIDDRLDYYDIYKPEIKKNADCTAAIFMADDLRSDDNGLISLNIQNYGETYNLCPNERFYNQPIAAGPMISGFLVKEDIIVTTGSFVNNRNVKELRIIFDFRLTKRVQDLNFTLSLDNVYKGKEIIHKVYKRGGHCNDWALVRLDRKVNNARSLTLSNRDAYAGQHVYVIGYPLGLPLKYAPGGIVRGISTTCFAADLDAYSNNPGSPVFCAETHEVIGVITHGKEKDFRWTGNCWTTITYPKDDKQSWDRCAHVSLFRKSVSRLGKENILEVPVLNLFEKFLTMCNENFTTDIIDKKGRKSSEFQFGYDLEFACEIHGEKNLNLRIICRNYTDKLKMEDLTKELATTLLDQKNNPIDHWIVIAPFAKISNDLNLCLNSWEVSNKYPFKVQVWNTDNYSVDLFFALVPDIYDMFFKPTEGRKHPNKWSEEEITSNLEFWKKRLDLRPTYLGPSSMEKEARALLENNQNYTEARKLLSDAVKQTPHRRNILESEFGFLYDFSGTPESDKTFREENEEIVEYRRKLWYILSEENNSYLAHRWDDVTTKDTSKAEGGRSSDTMAEESDLPESETLIMSSEMTPEEKGEQLENAVMELILELFQDFFLIGDEELTKLRKQKKGPQHGHDVAFECSSKISEKVSCHIECKNKKDPIKEEHIIHKLMASKRSNQKIDCWILISAQSDICNELEEALAFYRKEDEFPFDIQIWSYTPKDPERSVAEFFGLKPNLYEEFYGKKEINGIHPKNWTEEKRKLVRDKWIAKLKLPSQIPKVWKNYLNTPSSLLLNEEVGRNSELEALFKHHVDLRCLDEKSRLLPGTMESHVRQWLKSKEYNSMLILGEFGDGKTIFTYLMARKLAAEFLEDPKNGWVPVRFSLNNFIFKKDPHEFLKDRLNVLGVNFPDWNKLKESKKILVILDGFDEMTPELDWVTIKKNIKDIHNCYKEFEGLKIILTSRPHFFESRDGKALLLERIGNPRLYHLASIDRNAILTYLKKLVRSPRQEEFLRQLAKMYDPLEPASKPLFLQMFISTLHRLEEEIPGTDTLDEINELGLYEKYTSVCFERNKALLEIGIMKLSDIVKNLAIIMEEIALKTQELGCNHLYLKEQFVEPEKKEFAKRLWELTNPDEIDLEEKNKNYDMENDALTRVSVRSLLVRVREDEKKWPVKFCHRSMREYFVAKGICRALEENKTKAKNLLATLPLSPAIIHFSAGLMQKENSEMFEELLKEIVGSAVISAQNNKWGGPALTLLYRLKGQLPSNNWTGLYLEKANLSGADLSNMVFKGSILRKTILDNVNFKDSDFRGCDLTGARIEETAEVHAVTCIHFGNKIIAAYKDNKIRVWKNIGKKGKVESDVICENTEGAIIWMGIPHPSHLVAMTNDEMIFFDVNESDNLIQKARFKIKSEYSQVIVKENMCLLLKRERNSNDKPELVCLEDDSPKIINSIETETVVICENLAKRAIVLAKEGQELEIIGLGDSEISIPLMPHVVEPKSLCVYNKDPKYLLACGLNNGEVLVWEIDFENENCIQKLLMQKTIHEGMVSSLVFLNDKSIVSGGIDRKIAMCEFDPNKTEQKNVKVDTFHLSLNCRGMKLDGVIRKTIEGKKLRELKDKADRCHLH